MPGGRESDAPVASPEALRAAMRRWSTGVTVITMQAAGELRGATINSFTSVSLEPPLILICLDRRARTHALLEAVRHFCVNVLAEEQAGVADQFAGRRSQEHGDFVAVSRGVTDGGAPVLDGCLAWLDCEVVETHPAGDHTIFFAVVRAARVGEEGQPLLYHAGHYRQLLPAVE